MRTFFLTSCIPDFLIVQKPCRVAGILGLYRRGLDAKKDGHRSFVVPRGKIHAQPLAVLELDIELASARLDFFEGARNA